METSVEILEVADRFGRFDWLTVIFYLVFMVAIGVASKYLVQGTSDYFRGGGKMLWWMAGASAFMQQFSAWSFTGAASEAFLNGPIVLTIFIANGVGYLGNYFYFAPKLRQLRVITPIQAVRQRYGRVGEQFFTWVFFPVGILYAGIWLNALSIFISSVFGLPMIPTILVVGGVVVFSATVSGSWAVVSSDFMQTMILMIIAVTTAVLCLIDIGGPMEIVRQFPAESVLGSNYNYPLIIIAWIIFMFFNQFFKLNHMIDASRYLNVKTSKQAKHAALLAATLMFLGPVLWFIPPMVARIKYPGIGDIFPQLTRPSEASYIASAIDVLPAGMLGLLLAAILSATMSSMDSGLNKNAGFFVKNFYIVILKPEATEKHQMLVSRITTLVLGGLVIGAAMYYTTLRDLGLFDLMIQFGALIGVPTAVPLLWGLFVKKAPDWAGWSTVLVGLTCSYFLKFHFNGAWAAAFFDLEMTTREVRYYDASVGAIINIIIPSIWYFTTRIWYREPVNPERKEELAIYWRNLATPVLGIEDGSADQDRSQGKLMSILTLTYGVFIILLALIPNEPGGRLAFLLGGLVVLLMAWGIYRSTHPRGQGAAAVP